MHKLLFLVFICLPMFATAEVKELISSVDRNPISADEAVMLSVTAFGDIDDQQPDFSALNNDFRFTSPSINRSTQIINGVRSSSVTWRLNLLPKTEGSFIIPSFELDGVKSNAIALRVKPRGSESDQPREFFLSTEVSESEIYLQQQLVYTVKIYLAGDMQSGSLSEPELAGSIIEKLGEDQEYQEQINGVRYRVIERNFAIIPQSSGEYVINSPVFEARVISRQQGQGFAYFNRTQTISRIGPEQSIKVRAIPDNYEFNWLPSEQVQINDEWQQALDQFTVGEPITRTITLTALGLTEEQLPSISPTYHPSFKTYPEQAQRATVQRDKKLISQAVYNTAIIAEQAGNFVLPEIRVPWFNVNTGDTEFAVIPAQTVTVLSNPSTNMPTVLPQTSPLALDNDETRDSESPRATDLRLIETENTLFDWLHLVLLALVLLLSGALIAVLSSQRRQTPSPSQTPEAEVDETLLWQQLQTCVSQKKLNELPQALLMWCSSVARRPIKSIDSLFVMIKDKQFESVYHTMMSERYSDKNASVNGEQFLSELNKIEKTLKERPERDYLELFPN